MPMFTLDIGGPTVDPEHLTVIAASCRDSERLALATEVATALSPVVRSSRTRS